MCADQYTRKAPSITRPRRNVVVRLCSFECSFSQPLSDPANANFSADLNRWAAISNRTFVWNYASNFNSFLLPFPNYYVIGPNVRFMFARGVRGLYAESTSLTGELHALKSYLIERMLWDPTADDLAIISEFLDAFYTPRAAPWVRLYMDTIHGSVADTAYYAKEWFDYTAAFLTPAALLTSADALAHAVNCTPVASRFRTRVEEVQLSVYYPILLRWQELREFAARETLAWPLKEPTKQEALGVFLGRLGRMEPPVTRFGSGDPGGVQHTVDWFLACVNGTWDATRPPCTLAKNS